MAKNLNKVILTGRTTANVEIKKNSNGNSFCILTLAVKGDNEDTNFFTILVGGHNAEFCEKHTPKGTLLTIVARLSTKQNKSTGKDEMCILCDEIYINAFAKKE